MASAPKPGVGRRVSISEELAAGEADWRKIGTDDGREYLIRASSLGPKDEATFQANTGLSLWQVWSDPSGMLPILALFWFARMKNGERDLRFKKVLEQYDDLDKVIAGGFWIEVPDPDAEEEADEPVDPTASGPASAQPGPV